jgi:hypothetical protein
MLPPIAPTLFNLLVINATLDTFHTAHKTCLTDNYYGTYDDQSLFMLGPDSHCDPSELKPGLELSLVPVHPQHGLLFVQRMEIEGGRIDGYSLVGAHSSNPLKVTH